MGYRHAKVINTVTIRSTINKEQQHTVQKYTVPSCTMHKNTPGDQNPAQDKKVSNHATSRPTINEMQR